MAWKQIACLILLAVLIGVIFLPSLMTDGVQSYELDIQKANAIDGAVSQAIKSKGDVYAGGETKTEGHIILGTTEEDGNIKVYTLASFGAFGFENGIFTKISGSGSIPTVMEFSKNERGEYYLTKYKEPLDGSQYTASVKELFPEKLHSKVLSAQEYTSELAEQQEAQAKEYLEGIGEAEAKVSTAYVEKELVDINVEASNKLFSQLTKQTDFINNYPYWIGTRELLENGERYVYRTAQSKTSDGYDLVIFTKTKKGGTVIREIKYKIIDSEPMLVS